MLGVLAFFVGWMCIDGLRKIMMDSFLERFDDVDDDDDVEDADFVWPDYKAPDRKVSFLGKQFSATNAMLWLTARQERIPAEKRQRQIERDVKRNQRNAELMRKQELLSAKQKVRNEEKRIFKTSRKRKAVLEWIKEVGAINDPEIYKKVINDLKIALNEGKENVGQTSQS